MPIPGRAGIREVVLTGPNERLGAWHAACVCLTEASIMDMGTLVLIVVVVLLLGGGGFYWRGRR